MSTTNLGVSGSRPFRPVGGKKISSGSVTITMSDFQTYEMQARQMECKKWIETVINEVLDMDIHLALKDGVALCKLANRMFPGIVPRVNKTGSVTFKLLENINSFLVVPRKMGINENQVFIATDLWDNKNIQKVIGTINVMASIACAKGFPIKWPLVDDPTDLKLITFTPSPNPPATIEWDNSFINNPNNSNNSNTSPQTTPNKSFSNLSNRSIFSPPKSTTTTTTSTQTSNPSSPGFKPPQFNNQQQFNKPTLPSSPISSSVQVNKTTTTTPTTISSASLNKLINQQLNISTTTTTTTTPQPVPQQPQQPTKPVVIEQPKPVEKPIYTSQSLESAIRDDNLELVKNILQEKIDINSIFGKGGTGLHLSVIGNRIEILKYLLSRDGVNCNISDLDGNTPLHLAVLKASLPMIELLLKSNAKCDVNAVNKDGSTPIMMVSVNGDEKIVDILMEHGANVNSSNNKGNTALHYATLRGHKKLVDKLLEVGSDVNAVNQDGASSLHVAAEENFPGIVESLANSGARVDHQRLDGWTPLYSAAYKGNIETAVSLLGKGAQVDAQNLEGWTPLHAACAEGHTKLAELLITTYNANVNRQNNQGTTALFHSCSSGHLELVKLLIKNYKADPSLSKQNGWKPIHIACYNENDDITRFLVDETNIDLNACNSEIKGYAPIHILISTEEPRLEIIELLLRKKIDINRKNINGSTPLHLAVFWSHFKVLELLLKYNADLNEKNNKGRTPLSLACHYGNEEIAKYLAEKTNHDFKSLKIKNNKQKILDMEIPDSPPVPTS